MEMPACTHAVHVRVCVCACACACGRRCVCMSHTWSARFEVRTRSHTMSNNTMADGVLGKG